MTVFSFGHRTTVAANASTYLPGTGGTNQAAEISLVIPHAGTLKNLYWDCQSNGLTGAGNKFTIKVGTLHATPTAAAPALTDALVVPIDGKTNGTAPFNFPVVAGQRIAVQVQNVAGGTNISRLRVSFELETAASATGTPHSLDAADGNPTDALFVAPGGNVGIGTSGPASKLTLVIAPGKSPQNGLAPIGNYNLLLRGEQTTPGSMVGIALHPGTDTAPGTNTFTAITAKRIDNYNAEIGFVTLNGTTPSQKMVISSNGNVGIGTTSPQGKLDVAGAIKIADGTQGLGKVLTSDANGLASWVAAGGPTIHYLGENYGGGIVFYVYDNGQHGLIAATTDQSTGIRWDAGTYNNTMAYADGVGAGKMNTAIIIANQGFGDGAPYAARVCCEYSIIVDGINYGDWYLPSKYELSLIHLNLYQAGLGGLADYMYWSSTECSTQNNGGDAWRQYFPQGNIDPIAKPNIARVRAIRAF